MEMKHSAVTGQPEMPASPRDATLQIMLTASCDFFSIILQRVGKDK